MSKVRINLRISRSGHASRREADRLLSAGRVTCLIDGKPVVLKPGDSVDEDAVILIDGKEISYQEKKYVIYYKPKGEVCTSAKADKRSILKSIKSDVSLTYAGRLDKDSQGLVLLTNDGELNNNLMRARFEHEKEYVCKLDRAYDDDFLQRMSSGVPILDTVTRPCEVSAVDEVTFRIVLTQGLNRQIRRMCNALGYGVVDLKRVRIANLVLGDMKPGEQRDLTKDEIQQLLALTNNNE